MSNSSSISENSKVSLENGSGSSTTTTVYSSSDVLKHEATAQDSGESLSLREKTRMGFVQDQDVHGQMAYTETQVHHDNATPIRPSLTLNEIGNSAGALLRYNRERLGYSMQTIANMLKVRTSTISDLENDRLAQETAVKFTTRLLSRYASILNLDQDTVINLYMQKVSSMVKITQEVSEHSKRDSHLRRDFLLIILILIVAGGGYFIFGGEESKKNQADASEQMVSGQITPDGKEVVVTENPVIIEDPRNASEPVKPLSENTVKAQAQAQALNASAEKEDKSAQQHPVSLPLNDQTVERKKAEQAKTQALKEQAQAQKAQAQAKAAEAAKAQAEQDKAEAQAKAQAEADKQAKAKEEALAKAKAEEAKAEEAKAEEDKDATPSLNRKLKDISSQVKIVDQQQNIPSLNRVDITVLKDVALEVKDVNKVIKTGVFKAGDVINLRGIPPFVVSVSDTTAVRINYLEGVLRTPNAKQVTFKLPKH